MLKESSQKNKNNNVFKALVALFSEYFSLFCHR